LSEAEATPIETSPPLLAFDGDCRICVGSIRGLQKWGLLGDLETSAATLVTGEDRKVLDQHRRAGEIVLLLENRTQALTGAAAFRWILQRRFPGLLTRTLDGLPVFWIMTLGYRLVASWRRIVVPPPTAPDPLLPEPGWVKAFRGSISLIFILLAPSLVTAFHSWLGVGNGFESLNPLTGPAPSFLLIMVILTANALIHQLTGNHRFVDLIAVQSFVLVTSLLGSGMILAVPALLTEVPLIVVCMTHVTISAAWVQNYWRWLGVEEGKKGLTAQLTTTLAVTLGGATLWTGFQPLAFNF